MPATATTKPTGAKSNMAKGSPIRSARMVAIMMLGGVPIMVTGPPSSEAKASGIKTRAGA